MSAIIELATGATATAKFGSGVNKALAAEAKSVFEVKDAKADFRKLAARVERTSNATLEMEKINKISISNGGDLEDGSVEAVYTVIDDQELITFNSPLAISAGFKLTPKLVRQARSAPQEFIARYRKKIAFDIAKKEDIYIASVLIAATDKIYGGSATGSASLQAGDVMTTVMFEDMVTGMQDNEYDATDFIGTAYVIGELRKDARLLNDSGYNVVIKEDGSTVTSIGDVKVHLVKGTTVLPNFATASGSGSYGIMIDREGAFGIVDFIKAPGANPVQMYMAKPNPVLYDGNFHKLLGQSEVECQILTQNAIKVAMVSKE